MRKVIVVGLDGLDPTLAQDLLNAGEMPNLAALQAQGGFTRVATTAPAQTPVAWSTFATGLNPGGHGIFDFLRRDPKTYLPDLALNRYEQKNAFTPPRVVNSRSGTPLWSYLSEAGIESAIIRCPCSYPPESIKGRLLSGMGVPDLRGGLGTGTFYSTVPDIQARESEQVVTVQLDQSQQTITTHLVGPRDPKDRSRDLKVEIRLQLDYDRQRAILRCDGEPNELVLEQNRWSDWLRVKFKAGMFQTVKGMTRFCLRQLKPHFELYATPFNFDPESPLFPISAPQNHSAELVQDLGLYYTAGMIEDHAGLSNERLDESAFLDQANELWDEREAMMVRELDRLREGFLFCLFDTPDRVQHMFWRHREPDHPANRGRRTSALYAKTVEEQYKRADQALGAVLEFVDDQTLVIAMSDHGFGSFRRCVDLNAWLHQQGYLTLKDGRTPGHEAGDMLRGIDWSKTRAYALGLGGVYLNLQGREGQGIVKPGEASQLSQEIIDKLTGITDTEHNAVAVRRVQTREELYRGPKTDQAPDLLVQMARGYRVGWSTSLGGVSSSVFSDNDNAWSGDHIIDPELVPGMLAMNRPFRQDKPHLMDLAPTILEAFGVPKPQIMEGASLL